MSDKPNHLDQLYNQKRARTLLLVQQCISELKKQKIDVSLSSIVAISKLIDVNKKGISQSTIYCNRDAHCHYLSARTWAPKRSLLVKKTGHWAAEVQHIRLVSDINAKRLRLKRYKKSELIELVIALQSQCHEMEFAILQYSGELYDSL